MKYYSKYRTPLLSILLICLSTLTYSQNKKYKARVSLEYIKVMNQESYIAISAKYKGEEGFEQASNLQFTIYKEVLEDSLVSLGQVETNDNGKAKFVLKDIGLDNQTDSLAINTYLVTIEDNEKFRDAKKSISFSEASLTIGLEMVDSTYQISAVLTDAVGRPVQGEYLKVGLKRLYGMLQTGKDNYETNENGAILVSLDERMPGIDGNLTYQVLLKESDTYGTIKAQIIAPIGTLIEDESSFDERTMWSPPSKTPFYLLLFPNLMILGVWIPLILLTFNLYRISKSKAKNT